jgi:homoserine O-acetyltransferase
VSDIIHDSVTFRDFHTVGGETLPEVTIAYTARGRMAPGGRNAVLLTHGGTSGHRLLESSSGSAWAKLAGPGAPFDTDDSLVICSNALGGGYGSTNAASIDPRTGKPHGSRFPALTIEDTVRAQMRMLECLGVTHLKVVAGPSYGGFQALQWGVTFPDFMDGIVAIVTSIRPAPFANSASLKAWLESDPNWNGGDHYETVGVRDTMIRFMIDTFIRYGVANTLAAQYPDPSALDTELHRLAAAWADTFDANSLFTLGHQVDTYDVSGKLDRMRAPLLWILSRTDQLYPPSLAPGVMAELRAAGVDARYFEIDSDRGHLAFNPDAGQCVGPLYDFMRHIKAKSDRHPVGR